MTGYWTIQSEFDNDPAYILDGEDVVAEIPASREAGNEDSAMATNADRTELLHLLKAAPDLLAACKTVLVLIENRSPITKHPVTGQVLGRSPAAQHQIDILTAAIAKAKK